ncbi:hypothetical protein NEA36_001465 [Listeria monocytogenes]|nr:hypothetical protein [Listeria monocytogenes]EJH4963463.1 hypothetical protein [Listeria monocytogenes]EJH5299546.1 hypothetical protein [Listeria monocytogenes]EKZ1064600.1 hypothetical protein [Listeria monocytogenes]
MNDSFDVMGRFLEEEIKRRTRNLEKAIFLGFSKLEIPIIPNNFNDFINKFYRDEKFRQNLLYVHDVLNGTYDRNKRKQQDYYIVRVGEVLLFKRFEDLEAIFELDHHPSSKEYARKFDYLEEAEETAECVGGEVSKYNEDEMNASEKPKTNIRIYHGYQEFKSKKEDGQ